MFLMTEPAFENTTFKVSNGELLIETRSGGGDLQDTIQLPLSIEQWKALAILSCHYLESDHAQAREREGKAVLQ